MDQLNPAPASPLLAPEQQDLWSRFNDTAQPAAPPGIWALASEHAAAEPGRPAVIAARRTLSRGDLAGLAAAIATKLRGAAASGPAAICVEPGWEQVVAVAGAMAAGIPFLAVDPRLDQPARWSQLAGASAVLTQSWLEERLGWPAGLARIAVDAVDPGLAAAPVPRQVPDGPAAACLLSPADATGPPVAVSGDALADTVADLARRFGLTAEDRFLAVCPLGDEVSVYVIAGMLAAGAGIVIPDDIDLQAPPVWVSLMQREQVTVWHSPPALATLLADHLQLRGEGVPPALRLVLLGGEPLTPSCAARLRTLLGPGVRMANLCAAGAAGLWVSCQDIDRPEPRRGHVPVGTPLANKTLHVMNDAMTECPAWVSGRIYVGARGLVPGPGGQPDAFVRHLGTGQWLQRTNLTGRLLSDGTMDVVGDDASMATVHDHPLNLRDVEAILAAHEALVAVAAVPAAEGSVVYARPVPGSGVTGALLLDYLRTKMSPYLLPARVELLYAFPMTPGGRIDRAALARMAAGRPAAGPAPGPALAGAPAAWEASEDLTEQACSLAAQVLGVPEVQTTANLLDLGATSVQIVRLAVQAEQELGILVDVEELLRFPSVAVLLSFTEGEAPGEQERGAQVPTGAGPAEPGPEDGTGPLILDPVERAAFTDGRPAIRRDLDAAQAVRLSRPADIDAVLRRRWTCRAFSQDPVPAATIGALLAVLGEAAQPRGAVHSAPKFGYPSAGSLYPVQVYLTVSEGRVAGIAPGAFYYHPVRHRLLPVAPDAAVEADDHAWVNRAAFRSSAFGLLLVARYDAIAPLYGNRSRDYCLIEAGAMCQLLMTAAADLRIGLCPVGEMDFARARESLRLGDRVELVHSMLGGLPDTAAADRGLLEAGMLARIGRLPQTATPGTETGP
jgi:nonribosomal peptide synthetase protein BlmIII